MARNAARRYRNEGGSGRFVIEWGNDYYAGPDGMIHSS
jgi:hypothetical protein